jgi:hypothetical protein
MRASERQAVCSALAQIAAARGSGEEPRVILPLARDARKEVVLFLGLLPIVKAQSARLPRVLYLAADARLGARSQLALTSLHLGLQVDFGIWAGVVDRTHDGMRAVDLAGCWVIGDVDWSGEPDYGPALDDRLRGLDRVERARVPMILVHQTGKATLGGWPPPRFQPCQACERSRA